MPAFGDEYSLGVSSDIFMIVPSDSTKVSDGSTPRAMIRQIYVTTGGDITVTQDGVDRTLTVPSDFSLQGAITHVKSTGTDAAGLIGYV